MSDDVASQIRNGLEYLRYSNLIERADDWREEGAKTAAPTDLKTLDQRFRLIGDEDCGVGLECRDCWDGGRPLAYYDGATKPPYADDPAVENVSTISGLIGTAIRHQRDKHGQSA